MQCSPGENNMPTYILIDKQFEILAFPDIFLIGTGAYNTEMRDTELTLHKIFQQHLMSVDGCCGHHIEYLFCAQYTPDIRQI